MRNANETTAVAKAKKSLLRSQITAIIVLTAILFGLAVSCGIVLLFVNKDVDVYTEVLSYGDDGKNETASYYSREGEKAGTFALYDEDGNALTPFDYNGKTCYQTLGGNILTIDTTGLISVIAILDDSSGETINTSNTALLLYGRIERDTIASVETFNDEGGYMVYATTINGTRGFLLRGYEDSPINPITLSAIVTRCGIFSAQVKLDRKTMQEEDEKHANDAGYIPIINKDGSINLSIYGLEDTYEAIDPESGEKVTKTTPYFVLTDTKGNVHKVTIGKLTTDGNHYYVKYTNIKTTETDPAKLELIKKKEQNVYLVLKDPTASTAYSSDIAILLGSKANICSPKIVQSISTSNYYDVRDFTVMKKAGTDYKTVVSFTYDPLDQRLNTIRQDIVYRFNNTDDLDLSGYEPDNDRVFDALYALTNISSTETPDITQSNTSANYVKTVALVSKKVNDLTKVTKELIESDAEVRESILALSKYGLLEPEYVLSYDTPLVIDLETSPIISQTVLISKKTAMNTYYVWSPMYNQIVEIGAQYLEFMGWDSFDWVDRSMFHTIITFCDGMRFTSGGNDYLFGLEQEMTITTKYSLPKSLSNLYITNGSYDADITVSDSGKKSLLFSLTAKYQTSVTHTDKIANLDLDAIESYCIRIAKDKNDYDVATERDLFGTVLSKRDIVNGIVDLTMKAIFEGGNSGFPSFDIYITFNYVGGNLSVSVIPSVKNLSFDTTTIYDSKVFSDYYAYYIDDNGTPANLSESELKLVNRYFKVVQRVQSKELRATVSVNGGAPKEIDIAQFKALYAEVLKVSFYGRADRTDIVGAKLLTDSEMQAFIAKGDDCTMKVEIYQSIGDDLVFRMNDYSATKSYTTINNKGCFYINIATRKALLASAKNVSEGGTLATD